MNVGIFILRRLPAMVMVTLVMLGLSPAAAAGPEITLTPAERTWVVQHKVVSFGYDPGWMPFSYRDEEGDFSGIDAEFLSLLSKRTGLTFAAVDSATWEEAYAQAKAGGADFLVSTAEDVSRVPYFNFTRAYIDFPVAVIGRSHTPAVTSMDQLHDYVVASPRGYVATLSLKRDYPGIRILETDTLDDSFLEVARGDADVVVVNIASANYIIGKLGLAELRVVGTVPYLFQLRYAVRKDLPLLHSILDKGVASISRAERQQIVAPWMHFDYVRIIRWDYVRRWAAAILLTGALVMGFFLWHNRSLRRELEERLKVQRELEQAHARLQLLNEEKSGLMRMAAHDLRGPLGGLLLNLDLLRMEPLGDDGRAAMDRMVMLVHQITQMIRNLLDVEALENGSRQFRLEPIALPDAVRESLATANTLAARKHIKIVLREEEDLPMIAADRSALRQVTDNLFSNAVKYSPADTTVDVRVSRAGDRVRLSVKDQGPGISEDDMPRLFHRYACLSARPTGGELSTGLGLSIVKELVDNQRGRVWCESPAGEGACFNVEFPILADSGNN